MRNRKEKKQNSPGRLEVRKLWAGPWKIAFSVAFLCAAGCGGSDEPQGPQTRTVGKTGETNFSSIQECISASSNRDTCLVYPGTYNERIRFRGKAITVRSSKGPERTIIDGRQSGTVVTFSNAEDDESVLDGFTIRNGLAVSAEDTVEHGGGIQIISAAPVIRNCILLENRAEGDGGGIYSFSTGAKPEIRNVVFQGNTAGRQGGGLCAVYGAPVLINCLFFENEATVGGAINGRFSTRLELTSCTVADNSADQAGALYLKNTTAETTNSIYWNNSSPGDPPVVIDLDEDLGLEGDMKLSLSYVDFQGGTSNIRRIGSCLSTSDPCVIDEGDGILDADPLFVTLEQEGPEQDPMQAFYLSQILAGQGPQSVCVDAGDPENDDEEIRKRTTRPDLEPDDEDLDLGYHYPATM